MSADVFQNFTADQFAAITESAVPLLPSAVIQVSCILFLKRFSVLKSTSIGTPFRGRMSCSAKKCCTTPRLWCTNNLYCVDMSQCHVSVETNGRIRQHYLRRRKLSQRLR